LLRFARNDGDFQFYDSLNAKCFAGQPRKALMAAFAAMTGGRVGGLLIDVRIIFGSRRKYCRLIKRVG
jgi:hypothetical protein